MWSGGCVAGCRTRWAVSALIFFNSYSILIYLNSRVIHAYQCTNPVDLPWRTGAGPTSVWCYKHRADSDPVVVCCDTPTGIWKQLMKYCNLHWLHGISGVTSYWWWCLRLRQISLSRHFHTKYVWAFFCWAGGCPPAGCSRGCEIRALDFFQSLWDWTGIAAAALPSCLSDFGATRSTCTPDLAAFETPGIWRWGFLSRSWQGI